MLGFRVASNRARRCKSSRHLLLEPHQQCHSYGDILSLSIHGSATTTEPHVAEPRDGQRADKSVWAEKQRGIWVQSKVQQCFWGKRHQAALQSRPDAGDQHSSPGIAGGLTHHAAAFFPVCQVREANAVSQFSLVFFLPSFFLTVP